jgi:general secretion pathway protein D
MDLGIQLPSSITRTSSSITGSGNSSSSSGSGSSSGGSIATNNFASLITTIPSPLLLANLSMTDSDSNLLANPRIRVRNRERAKVLIGEKLPVITSTAVQNAGVASSVSYIDVGLKLEVEPQVYLDDEVGIKLQLEVNSNLGSVTVGNSTTGITTAYQVGTRTAQTVLRLHDGETQVLAGLINDNDTDTWNKVPGLSDLPVLGRLFSNDNSNHEKTEIVLLVTPRILRNLDTPDGDTLAVPAGTEAAVGALPLSIGHTEPRSLSLRGSDNNPRAAGERRGEPEPTAAAPEAAAAPAEAAAAQSVPAPAPEAATAGGATPAAAAAVPAPSAPSAPSTAPAAPAGPPTPAPAAAAAPTPGAPSPSPAPFGDTGPFAPVREATMPPAPGANSSSESK